MSIDARHAASFVGIAVSALKAEIAATNQRAERLNNAVAHADAAQEAARTALTTAQAMRASRLERMLEMSTRTQEDG